jgi:hypothetical protein
MMLQSCRNRQWRPWYKHLKADIGVITLMKCYGGNIWLTKLSLALSTEISSIDKEEVCNDTMEHNVALARTNTLTNMILAWTGMISNNS